MNSRRRSVRRSMTRVLRPLHEQKRPSRDGRRLRSFGVLTS
jgi:hypothetical protein